MRSALIMCGAIDYTDDDDSFRDVEDDVIYLRIVLSAETVLKQVLFLKNVIYVKVLN